MESNEKKFTINLNSPAFEEFRTKLDETILQCLHELHEGDFENGAINAKIGIELIGDSETYQIESKKIGTVSTGISKEEIYEYKKPNITFKISQSFKKSYEMRGSYVPKGMEIKLSDERQFVLQEVTKAQLSLGDYEGGA